MPRGMRNERESEGSRSAVTKDMSSVWASAVMAACRRLMSVRFCIFPLATSEKAPGNDTFRASIFIACILPSTDPSMERGDDGHCLREFLGIKPRNSCRSGLPKEPYILAFRRPGFLSANVLKSKSILADRREWGVRSKSDGSFTWTESRDNAPEISFTTRPHFSLKAQRRSLIFSPASE